MSTTTGGISSLVVNGISTEVIDRGSGRPILFLHPGIGIEPAAPVLDALARGGRLIAPSHPGFGASQLPKGMTTVDDVSYFYLDLLEQMDIRDALVIGVGLGGWLGCEIAVKDSSRLSHLVLANAVGVKIGDRETRDIVDIWSLMPDEVAALAYFDSAAHKKDYKNLPEQESLIAARNREATARNRLVALYVHNPKLKRRLQSCAHADAVPLGYRRPQPVRSLWPRVCRHDRRCAIRETIERAGHYPHLEQPDEFARRALAFADSTAARQIKRA